MGDGTAKERGLAAWEDAAEEDTDFSSAYDRFVAGGEPASDDYTGGRKP